MWVSRRFSCSLGWACFRPIRTSSPHLPPLLSCQSSAVSYGLECRQGLGPFSDSDFFFFLTKVLFFFFPFFEFCIGGRRQWHPTPVLLPGKSCGRRSLVGCCPWGHYKLDTTEQLPFHFSLSCIGGGNGNPLQNSCLKNPRDGGAWWAAVYGVAQSWTRLKRLSSSSSSIGD